MLELRQLRGSRILAQDGLAGVLNDVYVDASAWQARYLAVDSGARGAIDRLMVPAARAALGEDRTIRVDLKRRQFGPRPGARALAWLFSGREVARYTIRASDGDAGELDDLLLAPDWSLAGITIALRDWLLPDSRVVMEPHYVAGIDRLRRVLEVRLTRGEIGRLPRLARGPV